MPGRSNLMPANRRAWLLLIGRRLRAEYDALAEPVPPRLVALVEQFEKSVRENRERGSKSAEPAEGPRSPPSHQAR
jgi:hypothetical protein